MSDRASVYDPVIACYETLVSEPAADTCCKRIRVIIQRMQRGKNLIEHEAHFITLASQLVSATNSFGLYVIEIYEFIRKENYDGALRAAQVMIDHEDMLQSILDGTMRPATKNLN